MWLEDSRAQNDNNHIKTRTTVSSLSTNTNALGKEEKGISNPREHEGVGYAGPIFTVRFNAIGILFVVTKKHVIKNLHQ